jgi:hypothetical protein
MRSTLSVKEQLPRNNVGGVSGIDFSYGAARNLQLTATLPVAFENQLNGGDAFGFGNVELAKIPVSSAKNIWPRC